MLLRQMRIGPRLGLGFGVVLALTVVVAGIGLWSLRGMHEEFTSVTELRASRSAMIGEMERGALRRSIATRNIVLIADEKENAKERERFEGLVKDYRNAQDRLLRSVAADASAPAAEKKLLEDIRDTETKVVDLARKGIAIAAEKRTADAMKVLIDDLRPLQRQLLAQLEEATALERKLSAESVTSAAAMYSAARTSLVGFCVTAILAGVWLAWLIVRSITVPLAASVRVAGTIADGRLDGEVPHDGHDETAELNAALGTMQGRLRDLVGAIDRSASEVSVAAGELAGTSGQLSSSVQAQGESTSATASAVEQITVSISQVADHTAEATQVVEASAELAREGEQIVRDATGEMEAIATGVRESCARVEGLDKRSAEVGNIVRVIKDIADQTNLLALNAAIEAARAGELGRGFAVVADEVRKLAERTGSATVEIGTMIDAIQKETANVTQAMRANGGRVDRGVELAERAAAALGKISAQAKSSLDAVSSIAHAAREQKTASADIARSIERISQMNEENSAAASQSSVAAGRLTELATVLKGDVSRFRV